MQNLDEENRKKFSSLGDDARETAGVGIQLDIIHEMERDADFHTRRQVLDKNYKTRMAELVTKSIQDGVDIKPPPQTPEQQRYNALKENERLFHETRQRMGLEPKPSDEMKKATKLSSVGEVTSKSTNNTSRERTSKSA